MAHSGIKNWALTKLFTFGCWLAVTVFSSAAFAADPMPAAQQTALVQKYS